MDLDLGQRIADLETVIYTLAIVVVLLCAYIVRLPTDEIPTGENHCPLHRCPPAKCADRHKLD